MANIENYNNKEFMITHVKEWERTMISRRQYCKQVNIGYDSFIYWQRKLSKEKENPPTGFTEYKIIDKKRASCIHLSFPNGVIAELNSDTDINQALFLINNWQPCSH